MPVFRTYKHNVPQGVAWEPLDRIVGRDESVLVEADVTEVAYKVFDHKTQAVLLEESGLSPSSGTDSHVRVFDSLQTDGRWKKGAPGYNARTLITKAARDAASLEEEAGKVYRVEITWTTSAWELIHSVHEYTIQGLWGLA